MAITKEENMGSQYKRLRLTSGAFIVLAFALHASAASIQQRHDCELLSKVAYKAASARDRGVSLEGMKGGFKALYESGDINQNDYISTTLATELVYKQFTSGTPEQVRKAFFKQCLNTK